MSEAERIPSNDTPAADESVAGVDRGAVAPLRFVPARRRVLIMLASLAPAALLPATSRSAATGAPATADDDVFLDASRTITGSDALSADVARRIRSLLSERVERFEERLDDLAGTMQRAGGDRGRMLGALSDVQVEFALDVARPWYLGHVGTPSSFVFGDDAAFATFLEAQAWQKIVDVVPRPTYPTGVAGWWDVAPHGVDAPAMPEEIASWTFHPGGPARILAPDPGWKRYATTRHADVDDARRTKPDGGDASR